MRILIAVFIAIVPVFLLSNPYAVEVINEFQTAASDSQRIEFRYLQTPAYDTIFFDQSLLNDTIKTPAGVAYIDTEIILPGCGYAVIDTTVLNGSFYLPAESGFIYTSPMPFLDSVCYPCTSYSWKHLIIPAPPAGASAAKFHCWAYDSWEGYWPITDWYIDYTPTFGFDNDDYPGCNISGFVYESGSGQPINGAMVTATLPPYYDIVSYEPYHIACTTYTLPDGSYSLDSLLPLKYYVEASVPGSGYQPVLDSTPILRALRPLTNFNFYLVGVEEDKKAQDPKTKDSELEVYPVLFNKSLTIEFKPSSEQKGNYLKIYDAAGRLIRKWNFKIIKQRYQVNWDGTDDFGKPVSIGAYFICVPGIQKKVIKL